MGSVISATDDTSSAYPIEAIWDRYSHLPLVNCNAHKGDIFDAEAYILCLSSGQKYYSGQLYMFFLATWHLGDIQSRWGQSLATFHSHTLEHT